MSSPANSVVVQVAEVKEAKPKAPRKPTLPAKYSKMLVFGFSLVESLRAKGVFNEELVEQLFGELRLMSSLDDQIAYYESFHSQASANAKVMKKFIAAKNKPVKEPKVRKPRAKKTVTVQSDVSDEDVIQNLVDAARNEPEVKEKKPRKNAKKTEVVQEAPVEPEVNEKKPRKNAKKPEVVQEAPVEAPVEPEVKVKKTKAKAKAPVDPVPSPEPTAAAEFQPKTNTNTKTNTKDKKPRKNTKLDQDKDNVLEQPVVHDNEDDDEEILTKETSIDGVTFLIDQHNNLYHPTSHAFIRTL
jgi:hypothetical protein